MKNTYSYLISLILLLSFLSCKKEVSINTINIIPIPKQLKQNEGYFEINNKTKIVYTADNDVERIASFLSIDLEKRNLNPQFVTFDKNIKLKNVIYLELNPQLDLPKEAYKLSITNNGFHVSASNAAGLFYGYQTIKQLLPANYSKDLAFHHLEIEDVPRFKWRGMHLDVCRHFMPKEYVMKYIDYLASMKMNSFHWHLTEDQGWRIEIKAYPKLTEIGAWRKETLIGHHGKGTKFDGKKHGGFYTQEEIKEVVAYAKDRFITIVPEIEMPGHAQAAISAYPELGCTGEQVDVWNTWGVSPYIYNVEDTTFEFLQTVLDEVMALFPSEYIHIGGDEAIKKQWKSSKKIQRKIKELGLKDEHELQSYFIKRIEKYVNSKGRSIIGWDEILEGGLAPNATVMSWRGTEGGIAASKAHHKVIMSPGTHCYFDHYQSEDRDNEPLAIGGFTDVEKVYSFEPVPEELSKEEAKYILGAQGNVWTEYILTPDHVDYMIFPRMIALSEVLWSPVEKRDYSDFLKRLNVYREVLDREDIHYAKHVFSEE